MGYSSTRVAHFFLVIILVILLDDGFNKGKNKKPFLGLLLVAKLSVINHIDSYLTNVLLQPNYSI